MKQFTVPTTWDDTLVGNYVRLNDRFSDRARVIEVYAAHGSSIFGSGRAALAMPHPSERQVMRHIGLARKLGFHFNYLLNASCLAGKEGTDEGQEALRELLKSLVNAGVDRVTATSPMLIELIRALQPGLEIGASVICYVDTVDRLAFFEELGVDRVSVDIDVTRNFPLLAAMRGASRVELGLVVNSLCRIGCPLKAYHYAQNSHFSQTGGLIDEKGGRKVKASTLEYVGARCMIQSHQSKAALLKAAWIRPEDLDAYSSVGVDVFKIQGRGAERQNVLRTVEMYLAGRCPSRVVPMSFFAAGRFGYSLDVEALDGFLDPFVKGPYRCHLGCRTCHHCDDYAQRAIVEDESAVEGVRSRGRSLLRESLVLGSRESPPSGAAIHGPARQAVGSGPRREQWPR